MRDYYSVQVLYNLLSWLATSRFAEPLSTVSKATAERSGEGQHYSDSPIYHGTGCKLTLSCLLCPLSACKGYLSPKQLHRKLRYLPNPSTPGRAAA